MTRSNYIHETPDWKDVRTCFSIHLNCEHSDEWSLLRSKISRRISNSPMMAVNPREDVTVNANPRRNISRRAECQPIAVTANHRRVVDRRKYTSPILSWESFSVNLPASLEKSWSGAPSLKMSKASVEWNGDEFSRAQDFMQVYRRWAVWHLHADE